MLWELVINNLRYNASIRSSAALNSRKLETYLRVVLSNNNPQLPIRDASSIRVSNIIRLGGGLINDTYSFSLTYVEKNEKKNLNLVIKIYSENVDPIFKSYIHDRDLRMNVREWEALKSLDRVGFAVPKPYICECDSRFLGYPFLIMSKVEKALTNNDDRIFRFASSLAHLHNLEINGLELVKLKPPRDGYAFARRWPIHFKHALNIETKHSVRLKEDFDLAIGWLESNVSNNCCPKYCLIHGDAHPANALLTKDSQITFIDWEAADIGDPAFDVGNAYHMIKFFSNPKDPDSAELMAERFLSEYSRNYKGDIRSRLKFYQVVGILGYAIPFSSSLSSPIKAYKFNRLRVLPSIPFLKLPLIMFAFPFLHWSCVARRINAEEQLDWLKYFGNFMEKTLKN